MNWGIIVDIIGIIVAWAIPRCIKLKGKPIKASKKIILGIMIASVFAAFSSAEYGVPFDLRDYQYSERSEEHTSELQSQR